MSAHTVRGIGAALFVALAVAPANARSTTACPAEPEVLVEVERAVGGFLESWNAGRPAASIGADTSMRIARCMQQRLVERLAPDLGRIVGYKAGLTSKPVQERFGVDRPVRGVLLEGMILKDGAAVPAAYGARSVWEADMLLVVRDEGINDATTVDQAMGHIRGMRPFIELADLSVGANETLNGTVLAAINVGARYGVAGAEVPLDGTPEAAESLRTVRIVATGADGATLAENTGAATLGHPVNAVLWLVSDLAESGRRLKAGDLVSVGSFSPLTPPKPGQAVTVRYEGLPGTPQVSVRFE